MSGRSATAARCSTDGSKWSWVNSGTSLGLYGVGNRRKERLGSRRRGAILKRDGTVVLGTGEKEFPC